MNSLNSLLSSGTFIYYEAGIGILLDMGKVGRAKKSSLHSAFMPSFAVGVSVLEQVSSSILHINTPRPKEQELSTCSFYRWEGKIFPSPSRLRCHMEGMVTDTTYREHRLSLSFLPSMGDQSRENCGFEGTAQQLS